jgi:hypothetical protein
MRLPGAAANFSKVQPPNQPLAQLGLSNPSLVSKRVVAGLACRSREQVFDVAPLKFREVAWVVRPCVHDPTINQTINRRQDLFLDALLERKLVNYGEIQWTKAADINVTNNGSIDNAANATIIVSVAQQIPTAMISAISKTADLFGKLAVDRRSSIFHSLLSQDRRFLMQ